MIKPLAIAISVSFAPILMSYAQPYYFNEVYSNRKIIAVTAVKPAGGYWLFGTPDLSIIQLQKFDLNGQSQVNHYDTVDIGFGIVNPSVGSLLHLNGDSLIMSGFLGGTSLPVGRTFLNKYPKHPGTPIYIDDYHYIEQGRSSTLRIEKLLRLPYDGQIVGYGSMNNFGQNNPFDFDTASVAKVQVSDSGTIISVQQLMPQITVSWVNEYKVFDATIDRQGNFLIAGALDFVYHPNALFKHDSTGNLIWSFHKGYYDSYNIRPGSWVDTLSGGRIVYAGFMADTSNRPNHNLTPFMVCLDSNGKELWDFNFGPLPPLTLLGIGGLHVHADSIYVALSTVYLQNEFSIPLVYKVSSSGQEIWKARPKYPGATQHTIRYMVSGYPNGVMLAGLAIGHGAGITWITRLDSNGCQDSTCSSVVTSVVPMKGNTPKIRVYPNPASHHAFIDLNELLVAHSLQITVFNAMGNVQWQASTVNKKPIPVPVENWPSGIYYVTFYGSEGLIQSIPLVKQ